MRNKERERWVVVSVHVTGKGYSEASILYTTVGVLAAASPFCPYRWAGTGPG